MSVVPLGNHIPHSFFDHLIAAMRVRGPILTAVVAPTTEVALRGAVLAAKERLIDPILVGEERMIRRVADVAGIDVSAFQLVDANDDLDAARKSVGMCRSGRAQALMKGSLHTDTLMHAVLEADLGLRTSRRVSHIFVLDAPMYPRPLLITDAGINIYPTLDDKVDIVRNAIDLAHVLGIEVPNVAILSA